MEHNCFTFFPERNLTNWQHEIPLYMYRKGLERLKRSMRPTLLGSLYYLLKQSKAYKCFIK